MGAIDNVWAFLGLVVTVVVGPAVMWFLTQRQTRALTRELDKGADKLEAVHRTTTKTEVLVNGDRQAKEERIRQLEARLRQAGIDP
jgi:biopolymer transport protein ExbD